MLVFDAWAREGSKELDRVGSNPWLEVGAALVARDDHPDLDVSGQLARLDALAEPLHRRALHRIPVDEAAAAIAHHLYTIHGFRGNEADYGDPHNSHLNCVLERKLGIPITLAVVLLGVARRVGLQARGVSFPGHFLVRFDRAQGGPLVVDPFDRGRPLTTDDLERRLRRAAGPEARLQMRHLEPATTRAILVRVLTNLKTAHLAKGDAPRALVAATRVATLMPRDPSAVRDRGLLQAQLGAPEGARADLVRYLELSPKASDAQQIRAVLERLAQQQRTAN
ncbi:MAG: tetratricopeptide repeat protein [Deltaproteobacteria bacterium]|nr:tetratricopeptide repeat protein [Deltaproteobacteria bacterium]